MSGSAGMDMIVANEVYFGREESRNSGSHHVLFETMGR